MRSVFGQMNSIRFERFLPPYSLLKVMGALSAGHSGIPYS